MTDKFDAYVRATEAIEGILSQYFGGLTHRFVCVGTGINQNGELVEKVFIPNGQLYSDSLGQLEAGRIVIDIESRAHYIGQKYISGEFEDDD